MISEDDKKLENMLYNMLTDINENTQSRQDTFKKCVKDKLDNSHENYDRQMVNLTKYILSRSSEKVIKTLVRVNRRHSNEE